jgi:hypothetical protein
MNPMPDTGITLPDAPAPQVVKKAWWKSKTLWTNAVIAALAFHPLTRQYVNDPSVALVAVAVINAILRLVTHGKISLED